MKMKILSCTCEVVCVKAIAFTSKTNILYFSGISTGYDPWLLHLFSYNPEIYIIFYDSNGIPKLAKPKIKNRVKTDRKFVFSV